MPLTDGGDLLGQVLDPRAGCLGFGGILLVKPPQLILQLRVGQLNELGQRGASEVTILVVDRLDPGAINGEQFPAKQVHLAAQQHELAEHRAEGFVVQPAMVLKSGFRCRSRRKRLGARNITSVRYCALKLVRSANDKKSIKLRRKATDWRTDYLPCLLTGQSL